MADKPLGVTETETSSAATHYYDAPLKWIKEQGSGVAKLASHANIDIGGFFADINSKISKLFSSVESLRKTFTPGGLIDIFKGIWDDLAQGAKGNVDGFLKPLLIVKDKVVGALGTIEGQGLALFAAGASLLVGGGTLLGAGPETITTMLRGTQLLYQFNWNESDQDIENQIQGKVSSLYSSAGGALGTGLASFVTGGVFKLPRVQINMTRITILWRALNEEAREDMLAQLRNLARTTFFTGLSIAMKTIYRSFRKRFKVWAANNKGHPLLRLVPGGEATVKAWGVGGKPWGLHQTVEQRIEKLQDNPVTKNIGLFLEEFVEEFSDGLSDYLPELVRIPIA